MAILNGLIRKMNGSAGQLTFKQVNGMTIVSEKMTSIKNPRSEGQMRTRTRFTNIIAMYKGIRPLLNYGFESFEYRTFFDSGAYKYDFPLSNAERSTVTLSNVSPLRALVKKGDLTTHIDVEAHFRFAVAPIKKNTVLGELILTVNGKKLRSSLISIEEIASKDEKNGFFESFFN